MRAGFVCGAGRFAAIGAVLFGFGGCALHPQGSRAADGTSAPRAAVEAPAIRPVAGRTTAQELERIDPELMAALQAVRNAGSPAGHRRLAAAYLERGILDAAYDQFTAALDADARDAVSYEGRARVWRDWGFGGRALADAHRAVFFAPASPSALNTLGTIFEALDLLPEARRSYERARELDPDAAYAAANLTRLRQRAGGNPQ